jgi:deoxyhypusine synthase
MAKKIKPLDLGKVKTYSLADRKSKVKAEAFSKIWQKGSTFRVFLDSLPDILAGRDLREVISAICTACADNRTIIFGMGAHVIKVGLNPVIIDLMERGIISGVAMNGAGIIHDTELAMIGRTSEDVAAALGDGSFGMARETCEFLSVAIDDVKDNETGLGEAVGRAIIDKQLPLPDQSILAAGVRLGIPVTVHVAIGTDIIHMHPGFNPRRTGMATHCDFRKFSSMVATLEKGVYLNVGSAVILPEIFLKATTLVRNLGYTLDEFTTVNLDFIKHYRPLTNVIARPTSKGGKGINMIAAGVIETIE